MRDNGLENKNVKKFKYVESDSIARLMIVLQVTIYGLGDPLAKIAYRSVRVYSVIGIRYTLAVIIMLLLFGKRIIQEIKASKLFDWCIPCFCIAGAYVFSNIALTYTVATTVAFLRSLSVVMTPVLMYIFYKKHLKLINWLLLDIASIGLYLLCGGNGITRFGLGEALSLATAVFSAGAMVSTGKALKAVSPVTLTTLEAGTSAIVGIVCAFFVDGGINFDLSGRVWLIILYLAIISTLVAFMLQNLALRKISANDVSTIKCLDPVMTAIFSFILLGERLSAVGMCGAAIILFCLLMQARLVQK